MITDITEKFKNIKKFFKENKLPYYFISATNFNLMNIDLWVSNWTNINFIDCYDSTQPNTFIPPYKIPPVFDSIEKLNHYLLGHKDTLARLKSDRSFLINNNQNSRVMFLFFDEFLEKLCNDLKLDIQLPKFRTITGMDNKIRTTELGNIAGVPSVPNALAKVDCFETLQKLAKDHNLGTNWVIQSAYGDSGKTTYFISNKSEYDNYASQIEAESKVKIMKRINCLGTAVEACTTKIGTYVGPLLTELIGHPELTPYKGGWCGNELYESAFSPELRKQAMQKTEAIGSVLYKNGYRGYFEIDYLIDLDTNELYLGELNPRITGISAMTNLSPFTQKTMPLFLFHLLEFTNENIEIAPSDYNNLALTKGAAGTTSQLIFKYTEPGLKIIEKAPVSGVYTLDKNNSLILKKASDNRLDASGKDEVYLLRIMNNGEYAYQGGDIAILFLNIRLKQISNTFTNQALHWIKALRNSFKMRPLTDEEKELVERYKTKSIPLKGFQQ
jgi:hypothetical protein